MILMMIEANTIQSNPTGLSLDGMTVDLYLLSYSNFIIDISIYAITYCKS